MKPQQLAQRINVAPATLRSWAGRYYTEFLSPQGQGVNGAYRSFSDQDARILAWIAQMRAQNTSVDEIHAILQNAKKNDWKDLPPMPGGIVEGEPIEVIPREAVEEKERRIQEHILALKERYETQVAVLTGEREELKKTLELTRQEVVTLRQEITTLEREKGTTIDTLRQQVTDLSTKEAELRGKLEQYQIGGKRVGVATLIIVTLACGAVLTIILLIILRFLGR